MQRERVRFGAARGPHQPYLAAVSFLDFIVLVPRIELSAERAAASAASELIWCLRFWVELGLYCCSTAPVVRDQKLAAIFTSCQGQWEGRGQ